MEIKWIFTKWIPLYDYSWLDRHYVVFVRKNKYSGMMRFKVKRTTKILTESYCKLQLEPSTQFQKIVEME